MYGMCCKTLSRWSARRLKKWCIGVGLALMGKAVDVG
jgi:hypothetical protein